MTEHPLKKYRADHGLTQEDFANELGVWPLTVSRWETFKRTPRLQDAKRISEKTGIPVAELLTAEAQ